MKKENPVMSDFHRYLNFMQKSQHDQISELRKWSDSFSRGPVLCQTKPSIKVKASPATDACEEVKTAVVVNNLGDESQEVVDDVFDSDEDDHQLSRQIAEKEKRLLNIWEGGPAQMTMSQDMRITYLEEKLEKADEDNKYLEAMLEIRNADFARYYDLHWKEKVQGEHLEELVEKLETELEEKDQIIITLQAKLDCMRKADKLSKELFMRQQQLSRSTMALSNKVKKTKMASAHSVQYTATKPRPPVQEEIAMAEKREWERRK